MVRINKNEALAVAITSAILAVGAAIYGGVIGWCWAAVLTYLCVLCVTNYCWRNRKDA